jgi:hypothetical protein
MTSHHGSQPSWKGRIRALHSRLGSGFIEILLLLSGMLAFDKIFLDGTRFRSAAQHPFGIVVLLAAVQYGTNAGLLAAAASTVALLAGNMPPQPVVQDRFTWLFEVIRLPLLWFVTAVILGELRMRQIRERERLSRELAETSRREKITREANKRLEVAKETLETRIASQLRTAVGLYEAARAMEKLNPADVLLGVSALVRSVINPEKFSVYLLEGGRLELASTEGWTAEDVYPRIYDSGHTLFQEIVARQRVLSVANPEEEEALAGAGMIAAPLLAPESGRIIGVLKIEKLGFLDLNFSNVQTIKALCQWIGSAYENAARYQAMRADSVMNEQTELFAYGFLSRQLSLLKLLASRIGFDLSMVVVRLENPEELTLEQRGLVPIAFSRSVSQVLRKSDMAFDYQRTGTEFAVLLPATQVEGARAVIGKLIATLQTELAAEGPQANFGFTAHAIHDSRRAEQVMELQNA